MPTDNRRRLSPDCTTPVARSKQGSSPPPPPQHLHRKGPGAPRSTTMAPQAAQTSPSPTTLATPNRQHKRRREGTPDSLAVAVRGHPQPARPSAGLRPPPPLQSPCSPATTARLQPVAVNANPRDRARRSAPAATPAEDATGREPRQHHATKEPFGRALQRAPDSRRRARHQRPRRS
jgi:hypothetical protein